MISGITEIAHITTKQEMSRWTRAHADAPGINWSVFPGPGGTMIIVEHAEDRCSLSGAHLAHNLEVQAPGPVNSPAAIGGERLSRAPAQALTCVNPS